MSVTVSEKGWVVIPADLRKKYNLHPGAEVSVVDYGASSPSSRRWPDPSGRPPAC
jgi:AbrB family looped-hinge helix DNA binding protein